MNATNTQSEKDYPNVQREALTVSDDNQVLTIVQGEVGKIPLEGDDGVPQYIESIGAGPCIMVVIYDKQGGELSLAHIDAMRSVEETMQLMSHNIGSECHIIGGWDNKLVNQVITQAEKMNLTVKSVDGPTNGETRSIIIDSKTGIVYNTQILDRKRLQKIKEGINNSMLGMAEMIYHMQHDKYPPCNVVRRIDQPYNPNPPQRPMIMSQRFRPIMETLPPLQIHLGQRE